MDSFQITHEFGEQIQAKIFIDYFKCTLSLTHVISSDLAQLILIYFSLYFQLNSNNQNVNNGHER